MGNVRDMATEQSTSERHAGVPEGAGLPGRASGGLRDGVPGLQLAVVRPVQLGRDWFDALAVEQPEVAALTIVEEDGEVNSRTYAEMAERSRKVAGWLTEAGLKPGDRVLIVLGNPSRSGRSCSAASAPAR